MKSSVIALLSDFGTADPYVGIMKGVIKAISPTASLIDLTHQIPQGDIHQGAYFLWQASRDLPPGAVFLAVVDPGVGTNRKGLFLECQEQIFIGPDNGLFTYLENKHAAAAWELSNPQFQLQDASHTFHGRDIFAPAAAHAANNIPGPEFGPVVENRVSIDLPVCRSGAGSLQGEVINVDHFGNLVTSLGLFQSSPDQWVYDSWIHQEKFSFPSKNLQVSVRDHKLPIAATFSEIPAGKCGGYIGSAGLLEIAANGQSAAELMKIDRGEPIELSWI